MSAPAAVPAIRTESTAATLVTDDQMIEVLSNSIYPGARRESVLMVLNWCKASKKDPLKRPVHIVPMWVKVKERGPKGEVIERGEMRDVIMPGIGDYRTDAARTGQYAGISEAKYGPDTQGKWNDVEVTYPLWCEITVYRMVGGQKCEFRSGQIRWLETYATKSKDSLCPNTMWQKRPYGQLEKCAEAMALRRAFPEVGAQPTAEEMHGRTIDAEMLEEMNIPNAPVIEPPRRASEVKEPIEGQSQREPEPAAAKPAEQALPPASSGAIGLLERKMMAAKITPAQLMEGLKLPPETALAALNIDQLNLGLKWISTQQ